MHLPKACATSLGENISCADAEIWYSDGTITSKYDFCCPGPDCDARVTCVNLEKPKDQRRVKPYFKIYGEHIEGCETWERIKEQPTRYRKSNKQRQHQNRPTEEIYFDPSPPNQVKKTSTVVQPSNSISSGYQEQGSNNQGRSSPDAKDRKTWEGLSDMVSRYKNKQFNQVYNFLTNKKKKTYKKKTVGEIFVAVNGQDTKTIDDHSVLHGLATVEYRPKGQEALESYLCRFVKKLSMEKEGEDKKIKQQPTLFVPRNALESAGELADPKSKGKILQQAVAAGSRVKIYFYIADPDGKFIPRKGVDNINIEFDENNNDIHNLIIQKQSVSWLHNCSLYLL